ncbi:MAG: YdcF family protein [Bacteroidales bacterium]|nr:YdcF family protein [Bacteroidales bacterium]
MKTFNASFRLYKKRIFAAFNGLIKVLGFVLLAGLILALTDIPYFAYHRLGTTHAGIEKDPDYIVMLGSMGIPSPEDLMRIYYTADAWKKAPQAKVIIAFPADTLLRKNSPEFLMARELKMRGVDSTKIFFERLGYSTRTQALNVRDMLGEDATGGMTLRIITSPEHMFRAIGTFHKAGFNMASGTPTFEKVIAEEKLMKGIHKKAEKTGLHLRYRIWSYMIYEIIVVREYFAIAYYKIRGWI